MAQNLTPIQKLRNLESLDVLYQQLVGGIWIRNWQSLAQFTPTTRRKEQTISYGNYDLRSWQALLNARVKEAEDFEKSASNKDKCLIGLYLPCLRQEPAKDPRPDSPQRCQWVPSAGKKILGKKRAARDIDSHFSEHVREVTFIDVVQAACYFESRSEGIKTLEACTRRIYDWYQSSTQLQSKYKHIQDVSFMGY
jgi:hypothetical protein